MDDKYISAKFSISAIALSAALILTNSTTAFAQAYKTSKGAVVVTGLTPTQRYQIRTLSVENKPGSRQDKSANRCGEVVVEKADKYQTLVVGTETIDPATLPIQTYVRCAPKAPPAAMKPSGVVLATPPEPK